METLANTIGDIEMDSEEAAVWICNSLARAFAEIQDELGVLWKLLAAMSTIGCILPDYKKKHSGKLQGQATIARAFSLATKSICVRNDNRAQIVKVSSAFRAAIRRSYKYQAAYTPISVKQLLYMLGNPNIKQNALNMCESAVALLPK